MLYFKYVSRPACYGNYIRHEPMADTKKDKDSHLPSFEDIDLKKVKITFSASDACFVEIGVHLDFSFAPNIIIGFTKENFYKLISNYKNVIEPIESKVL